MRLVRPRLELFESYMNFLEAMKSRGEPLWEGVFPRPGESSKDFITRLRKSETHPEEGLVPATTYWAHENNKVMGRISLRHILNDALKEFGGHIGYEVHPDFRRRGYATRMLRNVLETAQAFDIGKILVTCSPTNEASKKTILNNSGVHQGTKYVGRVQRETSYYEITLPKPAMTEEVWQLGQILWDYLYLKEPLVAADAMIVLGNSDLRVARHAAALYKRGLAKKIVFSGNDSEFTSKFFEKTEAEAFAEEAQRFGVPSTDILLETRSTNTAENLRYTKSLLVAEQVKIQSCLLVQKPNMLRRVRGTAEVVWPEMNFVLSSHDLKLKEASHEHVNEVMLFHELVRDTHKIRVYGETGFITRFEIPPYVQRAFEKLVELGFDPSIKR